MENLKTLKHHKHQNEMMSRNHRKVCTTLHYIKHMSILASTDIG